MDIYVDATTLIALGQVGELDLLTVFDSDILIPNRVYQEVATEPARASLEGKIDSDEHVFFLVGQNTEYIERACDVLNEEEATGDTWLVADVLSHDGADEAVAVISDDRRVCTVARGLGASVTGTVGVVVRNVAEDELTVEDAKELVRRLDGHGLHMTGELRDKADELVDEAADDLEG
jgi:predicted nucleic acid-binding protein